MRAAVEEMMERLRLPVNARETRCVRVPEEPVEFLGYRVGRNYRPQTGEPYHVTRPSAGSVRSVCRRISELTQARYGLLDEDERVRPSNLATLGWANYFYRGQFSPAYRAIDAHAPKRLRRKHKARTGKHVRYPDEHLWNDMGLTRPSVRTRSLAWEKG